MRLVMEAEPILVKGFQFAGVSCGIKESGKPDLAVIFCERPATAAAAFTSNCVAAAPVQIAQEHIRRGVLRAVVTNSGNANAFTGVSGRNAARAMCRYVAQELGIPARQVLPCSTGRIGVPLPLDRIYHGIRLACQQLRPDGFHAALAGIMTTDAFPKYAVRYIDVHNQRVTVAGMAKGAGMIAPRLRLPPHATLLAFLCTDAAVTSSALRRILQQALPKTFNAAVVDGDTSTNDTVVMLASGMASAPPLSPPSREFRAFAAACTEVMYELARMVVRDGEGATRVIDIHVRGARTANDAARAADAIARSPLCKAAFYGGDPYMGRIVCALGYSGARFDPQRLRIYLNDLLVVDRGTERVRELEAQASAIVQQPEFRLTVDFRSGNASAFRMCSDLTVDYVRFNSDYRT